MLASMDGEETYTVEEAARVLKRTPGRIRQMLRAGELSGEHEDGDERKPWRVHKWSAHALRDRLQEDRATTERGTPSKSPREPRESPESASELFRVVQDLQRELGRLEGRLEITETAESSLRANLEHERRRAEEERARADAERERAEELRRELEAERSRGFWSRLFGG
jgi:chromosome segregation ATPase